jgi:hypothetical protein
MPVTREDLSALLTEMSNTPEEFYQNSVRFHRKWYNIFMAILLTIIGTEVMASYMGFPILIAVINSAIIPVLGFYISHPASFLYIFGAGSVWKFIQDQDVKLENILKGNVPVFKNIKISDIGMQGLQTYVSVLNLPAHFLIISIAMGTTLALMRVEHPTYALVFFPALATIGVWSFALGGESKYYRKITIAVLVIGALVSLYQVFAKRSPDEIFHELTYRKTLEVEVSSRESFRLCGIKPGMRKFSIPEGREIEIIVNGDRRDITSTVRLNKALPNESFEVKYDEVEKDGCAEGSFAVNESAKSITFPRQIIAIRFS